MNPYPARIAELHEHLRSRMGVTDTDACDILLACMLDAKVTGAGKPWIVIETDWMSRDCTDAWFGFGYRPPFVQSLASARVLRHGPMEFMINGWLESRAHGCAGIFVDPEWRRLAELTMGTAHASTLVSAYGTLMSGCVRLRTEYPKTAWATLPADVKTRDIDTLRHLTGRVLDSQYRTKVSGASDALPGAALYWCELAQKLSSLPRDWNMFVWSVSQVPRNVCTLYNEPERRADWKLAERIVRDSVNWTTAEIVRKAHGHEKIARSDEYAGLRRYSLAVAWEREMTRLIRAGVLQQKGGSRKDRERWNRLKGGDWYTLIDRQAKMFAA